MQRNHWPPSLTTVVPQHQKGLLDDAFEQRYRDEEACRKAWFAWRWPEGFKCPRCAQTEYCEIRNRQLLQCRRCRYHTSLIAGTILQGTKLPMHKLMMQAMLERDRRYQLGAAGPRLEIDDAYIGGERTGEGSGRGRRGHAPFIVAIETASDGRPLHARLQVVRFPRSAAETDLLRHRRTQLQIGRRGDRVISRQLPAHAILLRCKFVPGAEVAADRLATEPAFQADHVIVLHRPPHRHGGNQRLLRQRNLAEMAK